MKRILITGANSFVGTNIEKWLIREPEQFQVDTVDTMNEAWKKADFTKYDVVFHVAGIAHVNPKLEMAPLYYKVNRDLTIEIANWAKEHGVKQFIYMSSKIVYHASKSLKGDWVRKDTKPDPNDFYGDSKLQAEKGLKGLQCNTFKVAIIRPPMIYGPGNKGNLPRLGWLAQKTPVFPAWHNKRSMLHVVNLAEFVKQITVREMSGTFFPQNAEYADTVEIVRLFAKEHGHKVWISRLFNPLVWLGAKFLPAIPKMFSDSYYVQEMSKMDFDYQVISFEESLKGLEIRKTMN
ncbi:NAD-dependent epimerase/dehydratase family protein [Bacteroides thetaiotaomicron]|uniref:NAD-dependent epimerase/dehydratase family protein n=1 Tax=Bacteroides thetaiotaomicron TaxID=818 RepID=UPI0039C1A159